MFSNLLKEAECIQKAWGYGLLEAIQYIDEMQDHYEPAVKKELKEFFRQGALLFKEVA